MLSDNRRIRNKKKQIHKVNIQRPPKRNRVQRKDLCRCSNTSDVINRVNDPICHATKAPRPRGRFGRTFVEQVIQLIGQNKKPADYF